MEQFGEQPEPRVVNSGRGGEGYKPTEVVRQLFGLDRELLDQVRDMSSDKTPLAIISRYCESLTHRVAQAEKDRMRARAANDGNNLIYSIILESQLSDGGLDQLVMAGEDLRIGVKSLRAKEQSDPDQLPSFKLWASLYLGLREELFGPEQNERSIELINQLRAEIAEI